jgi:FG-GAP repeat
VLGSLASATLASPPVKLTAADAVAEDRFGISVSIDGDTAIVGAQSAVGTAGTSQGSAYVYTRTGTVWTQQAKLTAADAAAFDLFGVSVSINGDTAIVGADRVDGTAGGNQGAAYVYTRIGTTWTQQAKLTANDAAASDLFGISVSINGDTAIVGASLGNGSAGVDQGSAYVFTRSGTTWTQQAKLTAADAAASDQFGVSVSINANTAIVGAFRHDGTAGTDQGSAYVFTRIGATWTQQAKLTAADAATFDFFGNSVSINGDTAIVGAHLNDGTAGADRGAAYVFTRIGTTWTQQTKLSASDGATNDHFGISVSINGDTAFVGAEFAGVTASTNQGAAYVYTRTGTTWTQRTKFTAPDAAAFDLFGISVSINGNTAIVGATTADGTAGVNQGAAYVFTLCLQDLNGDGQVNGADLGLLLGNWGSPGSADINSDGTTDGADLGLLLGAWGACA